ncbi:MAG: MATE family efflux transporter, partial [Pseudomonadota bacterium]|nr:MATE family efflux transporter [Pseudomonadota bacterium]
AGNMVLPAVVLVSGAVLLLVVSPVLIFGWGPIPALGIKGAGLALVLYYAVGSAVLLGSLLRGKGGLRLSLRHRLRGALFREILGIGALGAFNNVLTNSAVVLATGMVGVFGTNTLAGFGLGIRVEYLQIPLVFGIGSAMVPMVGMNVGAGQLARARRVAWTGALVAVAITETVGTLVAVFPEAWLRLFTGDDAAIVAGTAYLRQVGPFYGFFGLNLALFFASQGAGRMVLPTVAALLRLGVIVAGGSIAMTAGGGFAALLVVIVLGHVASAATNCLNWIRRAPLNPAASLASEVIGP